MSEQSALIICLAFIIAKHLHSEILIDCIFYAKEEKKIKDLRKVLNTSSEYASYQDESGKIPSHWIASNEALYYEKKIE